MHSFPQMSSVSWLCDAERNSSGVNESLHLSAKGGRSYEIINGAGPTNLVLGAEKLFEKAGYECRVEQRGCQSSTHRLGNIPYET